MIWKEFRYSYLLAVLTLISFSRSLLQDGNNITRAVCFFVIVFFVFFLSEYRLIQYYTKNKDKNNGIGYSLFIMAGISFTAALFTLI